MDVPVVSRYVSGAPRPPPHPAGAGDSPRSTPLAGANEAESGALVSARLPHSMQHVESGENLVKILIAREVAGRRRSASRLYGAASQSPAPPARRGRARWRHDA